MVGLAALVAMVVVSAVVSTIALFLVGDFDPMNPPKDEAVFYESINKLVMRLWGIALMVLPGQIIMVAAVFGAALLSSEDFHSRVGYVRGRVRWWSLPLLLLGTIFTGLVGGVATSELFPEPSTSLKMFLSMARGPGPIEFVGAVILLSAVPAFAEESLFRGYMQRRLLQCWSPAAAIATSTAFFTAAHFDPQHMLGIIPLGVWLGYLAWRTGALWPSMLCHATQNIVAMLGARFGDPTEHGFTPEMIPLALVTGVAFVGAVVVLQLTKVPAQSP